MFNMEKKMRRFLGMLLALVLVIGLMPVAFASAAAATKLYMQPNSNWKIDNARFAAYFWNSSGSNTWADCTDADGDGIYEVAVPDGYDSIIFCRMNPSTTANNWNNKWNQTKDLKVPTDGTNCYHVVGWDNGNGQWTTYDADDGMGDVEEIELVYYLVGSMNSWAITDDYAMTNNENGTWSIAVDLAAGDYEYKVTTSLGDWYPGGGNLTLSLAEDDTVTFTIETATNNITAVGAKVEEYVFEPDINASRIPAEGVDYYLFGYINGTTYGESDDYATLGDYKFVDGTVTVTLTEGSYVGVKTSDLQIWYMTYGWLGTEVTEATLYDSGILYDSVMDKNYADKMFVPAGTYTITLTQNDDLTFSLSYAVADPEPEPVPGPEITTQPSDVTVYVGQNVSFSVAAEGEGLTYQWYIMRPTVTEFTAWNGKTEASASFLAGTNHDGLQVYCVVTDANGSTATSETVTLTAKANPFEDVVTGHVFYDAIMWAVDTGITTGTTATTFSPEAVCTRGQVVLFLYRYVGKPGHNVTENPFTDISAENDATFYDAVMWAYENGITTGGADGTFNLYGTVTRGQFVTFLWRMKGCPEPKITENPFGDVEDSSAFCKAILWAYEQGITTGKTETTFAPNEGCTRGQVMTMLHRALGTN